MNNVKFLVINSIIWYGLAEKSLPLSFTCREASGSINKLSLFPFFYGSAEIALLGS